MSFVINLPKTVATLVSEGIHKAVITKTIERTSRFGEPLVSCAFETGEGIVWHNIVFALPDEQNVEKKEFMDNRNSQFLSYLGLKSTGKIKVSPGKDWIGKEIGIKVEHEEYEGIIRARVKYFLDPKIINKHAPNPDRGHFLTPDLRKEITTEEIEKIEEAINV